MPCFTGRLRNRVIVGGPVTTPLRPYQTGAIEKIEDAIARGVRRHHAHAADRRRQDADRLAP